MLCIHTKKKSFSFFVFILTLSYQLKNIDNKKTVLDLENFFITS
ncbi:hypothetical protein HMPREF3213_02913 [Heyndrickxia coagulans]|uniref:Uncharacterized protein n=1 Tax=Heyndrickxia coagulans TaxID=1398 RepID=A0A133KGT7_HEYCO|nr:hypothetical protein HMPREF3213_02913 [Heyndrickxia coagulans]